MTFNPLTEKGISLDRQLRSWHDIVKRPFNKTEIECYSRCRQILMNGIETESWNFKHNIARYCDNKETQKLLANIRRIEDMQQTTINWLIPKDQSILNTTLGYEQVAVDLTAWLAQNESDDYVKETFNFGLLEDFDHLYRYSQWQYMQEGQNPNDILQGMTDILLGRPTQNHHNDNALRIRTHYNKTLATPQTKVNILTLLSAEQQTHNYYAEHGFMYGNDDLRRLYAEICDVEEEHITMYESLIDPTETPFEKLLIHEFTEVCNYYNCYKDEPDIKLKQIWEEFLAYEIEHLQIAAELFKHHENKDPEEIIGTTILECSHFESQKEYITNILENEIDKRLNDEMDYTRISELPYNWPSYKVQEKVNMEGSPSEKTIQLITTSIYRDIVSSSPRLIKKQPELLKRGLEREIQSPDTVSIEEYEEMGENDIFEI